MEHYVAEEALRATEGAVRGTEVAEFSRALLEDVGGFKLERERFVLQECLRYGGIHNPLVVVHQFVCKPRAGVVDERGVNLHAEGEVHLGRKDYFVGMSVLVVLGRFLIAGVASFVHPVERYAPNVLAEAKAEARGSVKIIDG